MQTPSFIGRWIVIIVLAVGATALLAARPLGSAFYLSKGALALERAEQRVPGAADQAIGYLDHARRLDPKSAVVERLSARARALKGDTTAAVAALQRAKELQPRSLLIAGELAHAYDAAGDHAAADLLWQAVGVDTTQLGAYGHRAFEGGDCTAAARWYAGALARQPDQAAATLFPRAICAVSLGTPDARALLAEVTTADPSFAPLLITDELIVPGHSFRFISQVSEWGVFYGQPLPSTNGSDGLFPWTGGAVVVLDAPRDGLYTLEFELRQSDPPPVRLEVLIDGVAVARLQLSRGDNSFSRVALPAVLSPGLHTVSVKFLNNDIIDGRDRDAVVAQLIVRPDPQ